MLLSLFREKVQYNEECGRRKQFHGFLIVINEENIITKFALTKSAKLSELHNVFKSANDISSVECIFSDNCCKDRSSLNSVFENSLVKLDVFHATNRLIRSFKHRSDVELRQFSHDVKFIVRQDNDRQNERTLPTASPEVILRNIADLKQVWETKISSETLEAINNLAKHAKKGCLSGIPVSMGTHNNENIHRQFNAFLNERRNISLQMFIALFSVFALMHNRKIKKNPLPLITKPIDMKQSDQLSSDGYGIIAEETDMQTFPPIECEFELLERSKQDEINSILTNICLLEDICERFHLLNKTRQPELILACCQWQGKILPSSNILLKRYCLDFSRTYLEESLSFIDAVKKMCKVTANQDYLNKLALKRSSNEGADTDPISAILDMLKCDYQSSRSVSSMCDALGIVLVIITGNVICPVQCMVPAKVLCNTPIILAMDNGVFHLTMVTMVPNASNVTIPTKKRRCRCHGSCLPDTNCSCSNNRFSCNEKPR